jgi:hypothetical protein
MQDPRDRDELEGPNTKDNMDEDEEDADADDDDDAPPMPPSTQRLRSSSRLKETQDIHGSDVENPSLGNNPFLSIFTFPFTHPFP